MKEFSYNFEEHICVMEFCPRCNVSKMCNRITKSKKFQSYSDDDNYSRNIFKFYSMQNVDQAIKNTQASAPFDNAVDIHRKEIKIKTLAENTKNLSEVGWFWFINIFCSFSTFTSYCHYESTYKNDPEEKTVAFVSGNYEVNMSVILKRKLLFFNSPVCDVLQRVNSRSSN